MRFSGRNLAASLGAIILAIVVGVSTLLAAGKTQAFTGEVSDSMCGAKHMMEGSTAECTRACVRKGSKYALVVADKVYTLDAPDKATQDQLDKLAGQKAKVMGKADGDTITVSSVVAGK
jgi:hypothetical protein